MNWFDIFVFIGAIVLIIGIIMIGSQSLQKNEKTFNLCQQAGYEMGSYSLINGYQCLQEECITTNQVKTCNSKWVQFDSIEEFK